MTGHVDFFKPPLLTQGQQKAAGVAVGVTAGAGAAVATGVAISKGIARLTRANPVLGRAVSVALPIAGLGILAAGGAAAALQAYREGKSGSEIAKTAFAGAVGLPVGMAGAAPASGGEQKINWNQKLPPAGVSEATWVAERLRQAEATAKASPEGSRKRADWDQRVKEAGARLRELNSGQPMAAPATPAANTSPASAPAAPPAPGNPFDERRALLRQQIKDAEARKDKEFNSRGGVGPRYRELKDEIGGLQDKLKAVDADEAKAPSAFKTGLALGLSGGALLAGGLTGGIGGYLAKKAAQKSAAATVAGVEKLAGTAAALTKSAPKGVIAGTVTGDKVAATVAAATTALSKSSIGPVGAYGVPALTAGAAVAGGAIAYKTDDPNISLAARTEAVFSASAAIIGAKYGLMARSVRPIVSPQGAAKLAGAAQRLGRETITGAPAGVAINRGARQVADARASRRLAEVRGATAAAVAGNQGARRVTQSGGSLGREKVRQSGSVALTAVGQGANLARNQVRGASSVQLAQVAAKRAEVKAVTAAATVSKGARVGVPVPKYKDVWQRKDGVVAHRIDMSVRTGRQRRSRPPMRKASNDR